jgi:hypothetical protein
MAASFPGLTPEERRKSLARARGCAIMIFTLAGLLGCILYFATRFTREQYRTRIAQWERNGFTVINGHEAGATAFDLTNRLAGRTAIIAADSVVLRDGAAGDVDLMLVRRAEVHGEVDGVLRFTGADLVIHAGAIVRSGLVANAGSIVCEGRIDGSTNAFFKTWNGRKWSDMMRERRKAEAREYNRAAGVETDGKGKP